MNNTNIHIDIDKVIQQKNPRLYSLLPGFVLSYIRKIIHQNDLNRDLQKLAPYKGAEKMRKFLEFQNITTKLQNIEHIYLELKLLQRIIMKTL